MSLGEVRCQIGCWDVSCVLPHPSVPWQVKLDITLGDLTKIGKSQKYTLSVDVEGGKLVVLKKQKDSQEDWNTFTHDKSEWGGIWGAPARMGVPLCWGTSLWGSVVGWKLGNFLMLGVFPSWGSPKAWTGGVAVPSWHPAPSQLLPLLPSPAADQVAAGAEQTGHRF